MEFGAYVPPDPRPGMAAVNQLERALGTRLQILHFYQGWGGRYAAVRKSWLRLAAAHGRKILLTWEPWDPEGPGEQPEFELSRLIAGNHDDYICSWAAQLKEFDRTIFLRPMHEMNYPIYPWSGGVAGNSARDFVSAWRHIHGIFEAYGTRNIRWVWSPLVDDGPGGPALEAYYPGDEFVDVVALDGYNWGSSVPGYGGGWRTFREAFLGPYQRVCSLAPDKIMWIAEVACDEVGGDKAGWIEEMFRTLALEMPRVKAVVWFNTEKERRWQIGSSHQAAAAIARGIAGPS